MQEELIKDDMALSGVITRLVFLRVAGPVDAIVRQPNDQRGAHDDDAVKQDFFDGHSSPSLL